MRIRRMLVSPELMMKMASSSGVFCIVGNHLPADANLRQTTIDPMTGCIQLFIESGTFDDVPEGHVPPIHPAPEFQGHFNYGPWRETQE